MQTSTLSRLPTKTERGSRRARSHKTTRSCGALAALWCLAALLFLPACTTKLYVPVTGTDGKARAVKVVDIGGDATNLNVGYTGPGGTSLWLSAATLLNSANTTATGNAIAKGIRAGGSVVGTAYSGAALLEGVKGNTAIKRGEQDVEKAGIDAGTKKHLSDNDTKTGLAEIAATPHGAP